jgi:L-serine/L-threonine ammonia-lyase
MSLFVKTPLRELTRVNQKSGKHFWVKLESYQPDGSFKIRGVSLLCEQLKAQGIRKIISPSGGNAGHAAAYCASKLGMEATIVVPDTASSYMAEVIRREGATVLTRGHIFDDANAYAMEMAEKDPEAFFMHPFDHPVLWEGHSTIVDEICEQMDGKKPDAIVLSVGGGGLFNGVAQGLDRNGWQDVTMIGVEVEGAPKFRRALEAGHPVRLEHIDTLANTLAGRYISEKTMEYAANHRVISHLVSDRSAVHAVLEFTDDFRILTELACGAPMSVAYELPDIIQPFENIVVIACGGAGMSFDLLAHYKQLFGL